MIRLFKIHSSIRLEITSSMPLVRYSFGSSFGTLVILWRFLREFIRPFLLKFIWKFHWKLFPIFSFDFIFNFSENSSFLKWGLLSIWKLHQEFIYGYSQISKGTSEGIAEENPKFMKKRDLEILKGIAQWPILKRNSEIFHKDIVELPKEFPQESSKYFSKELTESTFQSIEIKAFQRHR